MNFAGVQRTAASSAVLRTLNGSWGQCVGVKDFLGQKPEEEEGEGGLVNLVSFFHLCRFLSLPFSAGLSSAVLPVTALTTPCRVGFIVDRSSSARPSPRPLSPSVHPEKRISSPPDFDDKSFPPSLPTCSIFRPFTTRTASCFNGEVRERD